MDCAKDLLEGVSDRVKEKTPDQLDGAVDQGADMAKQAIKDQLP